MCFLVKIVLRILSSRVIFSIILKNPKNIQRLLNQYNHHQGYCIKNRIFSSSLLLFQLFVFALFVGCCPSPQDYTSPGISLSMPSIYQRRDHKVNKVAGSSNTQQVENVRKVKIEISNEDKEMLSETISEHFCSIGCPATSERR